MPLLRFLFFAACSLWLLAGLAHGQSAHLTPAPVLEQAFWEDPSGQATLETARRQTPVAYTGILSRGFKHSAIWVRLSLAANAEPWVLRITPVWLDAVTLHDPASVRPVTLGDRHLPPTGSLPVSSHSLGYSFDLPPSDAPRQVWLRLETTSVQLMNLKVLTATQAAQQASRQIFWAGLYASVLVVLLVALFCVWWMQPDPLLGRYLLRHTAFTFYGAAYLGLPTLLLSDWLPPTFFDPAFSLSAIVIMFLSWRFDAAFLASYQASGKLLMLLRLLGVFSLGLALLYLSGQHRLALQLNALNLLVASLLLIPLALSTRPVANSERLVPRSIMLGYYAVVCSSLLIGLANLLGWLPATEWSLYGLILHGLVAGVLASALLLVRAQRMARQHQHMGWKLQQAQDDMQAEQRHREEQSKFLHMLMHELKTPLSVVSLALGAKTPQQLEKGVVLAQGAIADMKTILERCVQTDQLSQSGRLAVAPQLQDVNVAALLSDLAQGTQRLPERLRLQAEASLPEPHTDVQFLTIILKNVLDNAARYSDPLTSVEVFIATANRKDQAGLEVRVANAPGLASWPDPGQLFTKYWRAAGAQRDSGSGLGLYLSRQLASSLGCSLDYAPSATHVEFVLWIPLSRA